MHVKLFDSWNQTRKKYFLTKSHTRFHPADVMVFIFSFAAESLNLILT